MLKNIGLVVAFLVTHFIQAQTNAEDVRNSLDWFNTNFPQEKIYLHLDRIRYSPGDTIWFKAYTLDANAHLFDTVSTNIYIDFIRKGNGKIIEHQLLSAEEGFPHSNISLPDTLPDGVYEIRAYTQWMRNFSEINFFHKEIYIHNSFDAKNTANEKDTASYFEVADLQFFPEGGNLVEGLQNRVAFKAVNKFGYGVDFKGIVVSNNNDTVTVITSQHLGMGSFVIKPRHGEKYYARIEHSNSKFSLPESLSNGYAFFIDNLSNKELVKVTAKNNFTTKDRPTLIGQQRGKIIFAVESQAEGNSFVWSLRKADIPNDGIVQLTLFNAVSKPQCERLIYNDTQTSLNTSITPDKNVYQPREKVTLSINVKDDEGEPVQGYFSLAVTDASQVIENKNGDNIYNYLYLTSDVQSLKEVKGHIEQPDYYFDNTNSNAKVHLDVLLMTQGWRRFTWNEVLNQKRKIEYEIDKGITLKGKAFLPNGKNSAEPITVTVFSSDNGIPQYFSTKTKADGSFAFFNLVASGETKFFLQGTSSKNKIENFKFSIDEINLPQSKSQTNLVDPFFFNAQKAKQSQQQEEELKTKLKGNSKVLKEVMVTAKKEEKEVDTRKTFYEGTNMQTVKVDKNNCGSAQSSVLQLLQGRVAGLVIGIDSQGNYSATISRITSFGLGGKTAVPKILVDGILMDPQFINIVSVPPCSVESIDVVTHPIAMLNAPGLISILTKAGSSSHKDWASMPQENIPGMFSTTVAGYHISKEFYSPKYPVQNAQSKISDQRATLYWDPSIITDTNGNAKVVFYNSDEKTSVHVQLEGISNEGQSATATMEYQVK